MLWVDAARTRAPDRVLHVSEPDESRQFASSPCYMHELGNDWDRVKAWRGERRTRLLQQRLGVDSETRRNLHRVIVTQLTKLLNARRYPILGFYWPIRGEIDVRELARIHHAAGGKTALPVIVTRHAPVEFWEWHPGMATERGVLDIPVPRERRILLPDVLIIPLLGFDRAHFRLGYGGGYYDRTLAAATPRPLAIGIASVDAELHTIHPQPHDVPMDLIVTDQFVLGADAVGRRGRPGE
jgi:5-formyltetrahydrofolate cyclo-ligase